MITAQRNDTLKAIPEYSLGRSTHASEQRLPSFNSRPNADQKSRNNAKSTTERFEQKDIYMAKQAAINGQIKANTLEKISASQITIPSTRPQISVLGKLQAKNRARQGFQSTDAKTASRYAPANRTSNKSTYAVPKIDSNLTGPYSQKDQGLFSEMIAKRQMLYNHNRRPTQPAEFANDNKEFFYEYDRFYGNFGDVLQASMFSHYEHSQLDFQMNPQFSETQGFNPFASQISNAPNKILVSRVLPQQSLFGETADFSTLSQNKSKQRSSVSQSSEFQSTKQTLPEVVNVKSELTPDLTKKKTMLAKHMRRPTLRSDCKWSKQRLCEMLEHTKVQKEDLTSPVRLQNLYAMITTSKYRERTSSGFQAATPNAEEKRARSTHMCFNETKKLADEEKLRVVNLKSQLDNFATAGRHKDQISRLSEAIRNYRKQPIKERNQNLENSKRILVPTESSEDETTQTKTQSKVLASIKKGKINSFLDFEDQRPIFMFNDNIDVEYFLKMNFTEKLEWKIKASQLDRVFVEKVPMVLKQDALFRPQTKNFVQFTGFWNRLPLFGSATPAAREGATMICSYVEGKVQLQLFGGSVPTTGASAFEGFAVDLTSNHWHRYQIAANVNMPFGSRPVVHIDGQEGQATVFLFSGQAPMTRINSGLHLCSSELRAFNTESCQWKNLSQNAAKSVTARKHFAMSFCSEFLTITGGMDANQNQLHDCVRYSLLDGEWFHLSQKREWDTPPQEDLDDKSDNAYEDEFGAVSLQRHHKSGFTHNLQESFFGQDLEEFALGEGSQVIPEFSQKKKRRKLLHRSHHTMNTILVDKEKVKGGYNLCTFKSYLFGGLFMNDDTKCLEASNHLIEVVTKSMVVDLSFKGDQDEIMQPPSTFTFAECMLARVKLLESRNGVKPLPRRDHCSCLISNGRYLAIYGGRNDQAFTNQSGQMPQSHTNRRGSIVSETVSTESIAQGDLILFNFEKAEWLVVSQLGFAPEPRWGASMAACDRTKQIYIFGGRSSNGSCRNEMFALDYNTDVVDEAVKKFRKAQNEISTAHKRIKNNNSKDKNLNSNEKSSQNTFRKLSPDVKVNKFV